MWHGRLGRHCRALALLTMATTHRQLGHPIRAVSRMTGLSPDTLRVWERRYGAVVPRRGERGRLYSEADIDRLTRLRTLVSRGHAIGTIARLDSDALTELLGAVAAAPLPDSTGVVVDLQPLMLALDAFDLPAIEALLSRHAVLLPHQELVFAMILPLLREVGSRWEQGRLRPSQEHLVSSIVRTVIGGLLRTTGHPDHSPRIVLATPSGERHELGLICAGLLAASAGYGVVYLGADLPASDIVHAAGAVSADIVLVSLTTPGAVDEQELQRLARLSADLAVWAGGPEAPRLQSAAGGRATLVDALPNLVPMLHRHLA